MFKKLILTASLMLPLAAAHASIINGDFTGSLASWSTSGNASLGTLSGSDAALISTASANSDISGMDSLLGISSPNGINDITGNNVTEASIIYQSFTVAGVGEISFDWQFTTNETGIFAKQDFGFYVLINAANLANVSAAGGGSSNGFTNSTSVATETVSGLAAGTYLIGFGVADVDTTTIDSGLLIDNVILTDTVAAVPLTSSVLLMGLGLLGLKRRK